MLLLRQVTFAVRNDLAHVLLVLVRVLAAVLPDRQQASDRRLKPPPTLLGFRLRISTIFRPDSWPMLSPDPSDFAHPVFSESPVLRNASSSYTPGQFGHFLVVGLKGG